MPTKFALLTNAELLLKIVSAEQDCPTCLGVGSLGMQMDEVGDKVAIKTLSLIPCFQCGSTGKVPILDPKLMRLPCPGVVTRLGGFKPCVITGYQKGVTGELLAGEKDACGGWSWVPNPDAWDMKKALHLAGYQLVEEYDRMRCRWLAAVYRYADSGYGHIQGDADPERARLLAVAPAVGT